jgi:membrane protease YdiL (CAAX protease family)
VLLVPALWLGGHWVHERGWLVPSESRALLLQIGSWPLAIYSIALNPFLEEYYWRGFLLPKTGIALGAVLFGLMHFAGFVVVLRLSDALLLSLAPFTAGLAWGWLRRASSSLWPCVVTHLAADAGLLLLFAAIRSGP